ncbi:hypothetical protein BDN72DRAFT_837124 [Pluteus cervinus]|uniref:Uncharacterized protein n=1 Tax=Pluteus cervinus TaxID=181527 RepID=A0ACD3B0Y1_9AGAR|nr:hypothetical protein BDN72DRAFT_837124 [Pluteus cervinus]
MPGPKSSKKSKNASGKKKVRKADEWVPDAPLEAYIGDIENAEEWNSIMMKLCEAFHIPDLTTRSGLRKVHANFDALYDQLDAAFNANIENKKIAGGIVSIYAQMSADAILRNKLFEKGFLDKLIPLLNERDCRQLALRALGSITKHNGGGARAEIAKQALIFVKAIEADPDDVKTTELGIISLSHSLQEVIGGLTKIPPKTLEELQLEKIFMAMVEGVKKPFTTGTMISHSVDLLARATMNARPIFACNRSLLNFVVAGLRSEAWVMKGICMSGLTRFFRDVAGNDYPVTPVMIVLGGGDLPDSVATALSSYGRDRTEIFMTSRAWTEFHVAMITYKKDRNLCSLGRKIADVIMLTEFSIPQGSFSREEGFPFTIWVDALPHCANALRQTGKPEDLDIADILDIKFHISRAQPTDVVQAAKKGLDRNPRCAYFYYAISLSTMTRVEGLRAAKKGLKCQKLTPCLRFQLLQRAVDHASDMGLVGMLDSPIPGEKEFFEAVAFIKSALDDAKTFVKEAPPDNRYMRIILCWVICLTVLNEEKISPDLREVKVYIDQLKLADEVAECVGGVQPKSMLRLATETIIQRFSAAITEFGPTFSRVVYQPYCEHESNAVQSAEENLAAWLDGLRINQPLLEEGRPHFVDPMISSNSVGLYECSWCRNPSAALKKCSGCGKTKYCDSVCQKADWTRHKKDCKA